MALRSPTAPKFRLDAATGFIHSLQRAGTLTDCGLRVKDLKTQEQMKGTGKVKPAERCEACRAALGF